MGFKICCLNIQNSVLKLLFGFPEQNFIAKKNHLRKYKYKPDSRKHIITEYYREKSSCFNSLELVRVFCPTELHKLKS